MRTIGAIIRKEFLQVFRDKAMIRIIFLVPVIQLIVLVNAANMDMNNISLGIVDRDMSPTSQKIINKLQASGYFILKDFETTSAIAIKKMERDKTDIIVQIPKDFEKDIYKGNNPRISVTVNAINSLKAGIASSYAVNILTDYAKELSANFQATANQNNISYFDITYSNWFNPRLDYKTLMLPGILALLITLIGILLSALNIVREKEIGTIEQLNVTPIGRFQFIAGKLLPFWILGLVLLTIGLLVSKLLYDLPIVGSLLLLYGVVSIYLFAVLGFGFLISTISETQSQAMFVTMFFLFTFILMSGLFTAISNMPVWAQKIDIINPTAYLVSIIRLVLLKGSTLSDIKPQVTAIIIFAFLTNALAIWRYHKTS
ncbi:MAG: ABC transporter permease [Bacteroidota bacterium]|nr:ABC transporter permease [Bacteroidota bacterium]